jgi:hypothetical protein
LRIWLAVLSMFMVKKFIVISFISYFDNTKIGFIWYYVTHNTIQKAVICFNKVLNCIIKY